MVVHELLHPCQQAVGSPASKPPGTTVDGMMEDDEEIGEDVADVLARAEHATNLDNANAKRQKKALALSKEMGENDPDIEDNPFEVSAAQQHIPFSFVLTFSLVQGSDKAAAAGKDKSDKKADKAAKSDKKAAKSKKSLTSRAAKSPAKKRKKEKLNDDGTLVDGEEEVDDGDSSVEEEYGGTATGEATDDGTGLGFGRRTSSRIAGDPPPDQ